MYKWQENTPSIKNLEHHIAYICILRPSNAHLVLSPLVLFMPCQDVIGVAVLDELDEPRGAVRARESLKFG